jgi:hypothetical protein
LNASPFQIPLLRTNQLEPRHRDFVAPYLDGTQVVSLCQCAL